PMSAPGGLGLRAPVQTRLTLRMRGSVRAQRGSAARRRFLLTSLAGALAAPLAAGAQQTGKVYTIGILTSAPGPSAEDGPLLFDALRDSGYHLGRNLVIEPRYAAGKVEHLPDLAADLVRRRVDLILAFGLAESLAAVKATSTIPIVFMSPAPVELGLVRRLARPDAKQHA